MKMKHSANEAIMMVATRTMAIPVLMTTLLWAGCGSNDCPRNEPTDTSEEGDVELDTSSDGLVDVEDGDESCIPVDCSDVDTCGVFDDGCGGLIECFDDCGCTPATWVADCPAKACEQPTGCNDEGQCVYDPVICGAPCVCALGICDDETPRSCGEGLCTAEYCMPTAVSDGTSITYENTCVSASLARCGTCGLGIFSCDEGAGTLECDDIDLPSGTDPSMVECDSTLMGSSFIYVDPTWTGSVDPDGSRDAPLADPTQAIARALSRGATAVIIGGGPVFLQEPGFVEGVSVYGGFIGYPEWARDRSRIPTWHVPYDGPTDGRFVGEHIEDFVLETVIDNVKIHTVSISGMEMETGVSNHAMVVTGSPGLRLYNVIVEAGGANNGGSGTLGEDALTASSGFNGQFTTSTFQDAAACTGTCDYYTDGGDDACSCNYSPSSGCVWTVVDPAPSCMLCPGIGAVTRAAGGDGGSGAVHLFDPGWPSVRITSEAGEGQDSPSGARGGYLWDWRPLRGEDGPDAPSTPPNQAPAGQVVSLTTGMAGDVWFNLDAIGRGQSGIPGLAGGGGGGGASGVAFVSQQSHEFLVGAGGGGGGAGGCGGGGGSGGWPGGFSVALFVIDSDGMIVRDSTFIGGRGGNGGDGGQGGDGARGGNPGYGGEATWLSAVSDFYYASGCMGSPDSGEQICKVWGARGGIGGDGQPGGWGGNGAGGSSMGGYCHETTIVFEGDNSFVPTEPGSGGDGFVIEGPDGEAVAQRGCFTMCGNGFVDAGEDCDDGNDVTHDGCEPDCTLACGAALGADRAYLDPSSGNCLAGFLEAVPWTTAETACSGHGGYIVSLADDTESMRSAIMMSTETSFHIGLNDSGTEGAFVWLSGDSLSYTDWCEDEPSGGDSADCVVMRNDLLCWQNVACTDMAPFVCEIP